jgi:hypothetical protein
LLSIINIEKTTSAGNVDLAKPFILVKISRQNKAMEQARTDKGNKLSRKEAQCSLR